MTAAKYRYLKRAANYHLADAQNKQGFYFQRRRSFPIDLGTGAGYFNLAADQNLAVAPY
jgi:hypothetical protein